MKIFVIADPDTALAFGLAGIRGQAVQTASEVPPILQGLDRQRVGLVLITEALAEGSRDLIERMLLEPGGLLILEIPAMRGPKVKKARAAERILSLLRR